jgi:CheY-like chemotaxis protein
MAHSIVLIEDDQDVRNILGEVMGDAGYQVFGFDNGKEALEWLKQATSPPDLIILDLMMPVMDGWRFVEEQQKDQALAGISVLIFSAHGEIHSVRANRYLSKPVQLEPLLAAVADALGSPQQSIHATH